MKKWEKDLILKNYSEKIRNAKPNLKIPKASTKPPESKTQVLTTKSSKTSQIDPKKPRMLESAGSNKSSISDYYESEKNDLTNIPLYRLLKIHNLQQYAKQLISRGFGYDLQKFMFLSKKDVEALILDIKVLPGHKTKLLKLFDYINSLFMTLDYKPSSQKKAEPGPTDNKSNLSNIYLKSKSATSLVRKKSLLKRQNSGKDDPKPNIKAKVVEKRKYKLQSDFKYFRIILNYYLKDVGCDFFRDSSDLDDDFSKTLEKIMNKYQNDLSNQKEKPQPKDKFKPRSVSPPKFVETVASQINKPFLKKTLPKQKYVRAQAIDHELATAPKSRLLLNLKKTVLNALKKDDFDLGLEYQKIKSLFISFDSGKLTSTLINLDIEEMTFCLACVILKFIEYGENKGEIPFFQVEVPPTEKQNYEISLDFHQKTNKLKEVVDDSRNFDLSDKISVTPALTKDSFVVLEKKIQEMDKLKKEEEKTKIMTENISGSGDDNFEEEEYGDYVEEDYGNPNLPNPEDQDEIEFEQSKKEMESILKESMLVSKPPENNEIKPTLKNTATFKAFSPDPINEEERNYDQGDEFENSDNNYYQSRMEENSKVNVSLCSKITYFDENMMHNELSFSRDLESVFEKAFNEKSNEKWITSKPSKDTISNFCKNIIITSKMEKEVTIICLIYIEKLIVRSGMHVTALNWRRVVFVALILASKLWDDESYENDNFSQAFPQYTTKEINSIEMVFLQFINFELYIDSSEYAKYYFILRTFAEKNKKSFPLRALDINTIMALQNHSNNVQKVLKETYMSSLNKTF